VLADYHLRVGQVTRSTDGARLRRVRVVRDYGMYDRRENPQYYPEAEPGRLQGREPGT
jgi:hypothetical protein